jgi:hypothetical protein
MQTCTQDAGTWTSKKISIPEDGNCLTGRYCFMEFVKEYALYHASPTLSFPVPDLVAVLKSEGFKTYWEERESAWNNKKRNWEQWKTKEATGWVIEGNTLKFAWIGFNATFGERPPVKEANDLDEKWDALVEQYAPGTGGHKTSEVFNFMVTQNELVTAAIQGIFTSLGVAFLVLVLVTYNILIALIGLLNITAITVVFLGLIPIFDWELGTSECIFLIAVVGLSVDYSVHMLHAYNEHEADNRNHKLKNSLETMGISVLSGAITTLLASVPLFLCLMRFFSQYGQFIFFVCLFSFTLAIGLLSPLLITIGPEGRCGSLTALFFFCHQQD